MTFTLGLVVAGLVAITPQQPAPQGTSGQPVAERTATAASEPAELPVSVDRIRRALARPPILRLKTERPMYRVEVFGRKPTIEDILGPDYLKGPVPYGGMTHQEFLAMVTPEAVRGYAAFSNKEAFQVAATSIALKWALQKAIDKYEKASAEREREAARREVQDALADLARARRAAGLPPK